MKKAKHICLVANFSSQMCSQNKSMLRDHLDITQANKVGEYRESVTGSVIQATETVEFEDCLWIGNHQKAVNGMQRVCTLPGV